MHQDDGIAIAAGLHLNNQKRAELALKSSFSQFRFGQKLACWQARPKQAHLFWTDTALPLSCAGSQAI